MGKIIDEIYRAGFVITKLKMCHVSRTEATELYEDEKNNPNYKYEQDLAVFFNENCEPCCIAERYTILTKVACKQFLSLQYWVK